jgi:hypothetical protein
MIPEYLKLSTIAEVIKKQAKQKKMIPDVAEEKHSKGGLSPKD